MKKWMLMLLPLLASSAQAAIIKYDFGANQVNIHKNPDYIDDAPESYTATFSATIDTDNNKLLAISMSFNEFTASFNGPAKPISWYEVDCYNHFADRCRYVIDMNVDLNIFDKSGGLIKESAYFFSSNTTIYGVKDDPLSSWWMDDQENFFLYLGKTEYSLYFTGLQPIQTILPSNPVPEPATFALLGLGLLGLARRKLA